MYREKKRGRKLTVASFYGLGGLGAGAPQQAGYVENGQPSLCSVKCLASNLFTSQFGCIPCVCAVIADVYEVVRLVPSAIARRKRIWGASFFGQKSGCIS